MSRGQIYPAKVTRPSVHGVLERKRLFRLLDRSLKKPVVWIGGLAGSGKTTLVNSYLKSRGLRSIWYQADAGDSDIATFFYYMGLAAKKANPRKRKPMPLLTPEYLLGIPTFTLRYFEELYSRLKPPYVIVIDNYQDVPEGSPFHEVIQTGIYALPKGINVILASRVEPPKEFARLRANSMMGSVNWNDLRLTENESKAVVRLHKKKALTQKAIQEYYRQTDGWVAGLVLLLEKAVEAGHEHLKGRAPHEVFDYFASEIFEKSDKQTKDFLQKTSLLPFMTPAMAEGLTGAKKSRKTLEMLTRNNFFTVRRKGIEPSYQYHPLFREFLIEWARDNLSADAFSALRQRSATFLAKAGRYENAAELFINAGQWEGLIGLIMKQAMPMLMQGRSHVLEQWLKAIPEEIFQNVPWLQYWTGLCRLPFNAAEAEGYFREAFEQFNARNDTAGVFLSWAGVVDSIFYRLDSLKGLDPWIDMIDGIVKKFGGFPSEEIETRVTSSMYLALIMRRPDHPRFDEWEERALLLAEKSPDVNLKINIISNYALFCWIIGDMAKAVPALDRLKDLLKSANVTPLSRMSVSTSAAMQASYSNMEADYDVLTKECLKTVDDTLAFSQRTGVHVMSFQITGTAVWSTAQQHDFALAEKYLARMTAVLGHVKRFDSGFYYGLVAFMELEKGNLQQALKYVETVIEDKRYVGGFLSDIGGSLIVSHIMCEARDFDRALEHASYIHRLGKKIKTPYFEFMALITESYIHLERGSDNEGLSCLKKAMAIGREQGYFNHMNWRQGVIASLCQRALEEGIETEYAKKLIRVRKLMPDEPPIHIEDWPWPVKIYTLGEFNILRNDESLRFSGKAQKKPLEMLKMLLARGGSDASVELLCDDLWPEADGDLANVSFKTNLHRLRKLLGNDEAVVLKDGRLSLNPRCCWFDLWVMERTMSQADELWDNGDKKKATLSFKYALELNNGHFLQSVGNARWVMAAREKTRNKCLRAIGNIGSYHAENGDHRPAVKWYQRGLELDELREDFARNLMLCFNSLGRKGEAIRAYERIRESLESVLGVEPSSETTEVYESIIR